MAVRLVRRRSTRVVLWISRLLSLFSVVGFFWFAQSVGSQTPHKSSAPAEYLHLALVTATPVCAPQWSLTLNQSSYNFQKVAAVSPNEAWAVGNRVDWPLTAVLGRWNGAQWGITDGPNLGDSSYLVGVSANSPNDIWATGYYRANNLYRTLTEHWNGGQWSIIPSANAGTGSYLQDIAVAAPNDVWAVGAYTTTVIVQQALIEHWDGVQWSIVPNPAGADSELNGLVVVAPSDIWAVGFGYLDGLHQMLIEHWDGAQWTLSPFPETGMSTRLRGIAAVAANDIWAVGEYPGTQYRPLIVHWDGNLWNTADEASPMSDGSRLVAVTAISPGDVWAVGDYIYPRAGEGARTLIEHWDGTGWTWHTGINATAHGNYLSGLAALSSNDVIAVGKSYDYTWEPAVEVRAQAQQYIGVCATVTKTSTPSSTRTITYTPTETPTSTETDTRTSTYTPTETPSNTPTPLITHTPTETFTSTPTPTITATFTRTATRAPTLTSVRPPCGLYLESMIIQCTTPQVYTYTLEFTGPGLPFGTGEMHFEVARDPAGPWTEIDYQEFHLASPGTYVGAFTENNIPFRYAWYRTWFYLHVVCPPWSGSIRQYTDPSYICYLSTIGQIATRTPLSTSTPALTATRTPPALTATRTPVSCSISFTDVQPTDYFYEAVRYLYCHGAISGYSDDTFRPYNNTTRGQLAKIVSLVEDWDVTCPETGHFSDVSLSDPFYCFIETALAHSIIGGYSDGTFRPGNDVTRGQLCKIIVLAQGWAVNLPNSAHFSDVPPGSPFYAFIETGYDHQVISGYTDGTFRPGNPATRGQICKIVYLAIMSTAHP